ncbi:MAG TPA: energy transducer TonB [Allosphingosinicella sp.]|nr:energy transducer TonB [Allosphingosinicella sp.]
MQAAGFLEQRKRSPTALTLVILAHAAALSALALAKAPQIIDAITRTKVDLIEVEPPPPIDPPPPQPDRRVPPERITSVPPIIDRLPLGPVVPPLPPVPPQPPRLPPDPVVIRADPPPPRIFPPRRARASLSSYFSTDDYPAAAIRVEAEGTTRFALTIGSDGRVTNCSVTGSSGNSALDAATCRILSARARYTPARDQSDNATSGTDRGSITWRLPAD